MANPRTVISEAIREEAPMDGPTYENWVSGYDVEVTVNGPKSWSLAADGLSQSPIVARLERITVDPGICHGQPVVRGLRYPVQMLLEPQ